ncbi:MAG TPA: hypothetical protein VMA86_06430 [Acetobacteraceae bacterium]|nr:hypothetical protein [Acetobacteraceae bacterium]
MDPARAARPTLRITRHGVDGAVANFAFTVWNPFTGRYQSASSLLDGLRRLDALASLIGQMHARKHPREAALTDAPDANMQSPAYVFTDEWAELRVNPADHPTYDTRRAGQPTWTRSNGGKIHAAETVCKSVGYAPSSARTPVARS